MNSFKYEPTFIVAKQDDEIIGVLKYGIYDFNKQSKYLGINYVDVSKEYQHKGIATELFKKMDEIVSKDMVIQSSYIDNENLKTAIIKMMKTVFEERKEKFIIRE